MAVTKRGASKLPAVRIRKGSRLLCPECGTVQALAFQNEKDEAFLICGHHRTPRLLEPHAGCISLEHVLADSRSALIRALFPVIDQGFRPRNDISDHIGDVPDEIARQFQREGWS